MSKFEHTLPLMNILTNIYKLGGVILSPSNSSCDDINLDTHTCGRSFARAVLKVAFVVSICFLSAACGNSIPSSNERDDNSRSEEKKNESGEIDSWERGDSASYVIGGVPVSMKQ